MDKIYPKIKRNWNEIAGDSTICGTSLSGRKNNAKKIGITEKTLFFCDGRTEKMENVFAKFRTKNNMV